jgi:hypothetical protein
VVLEADALIEPLLRRAEGGGAGCASSLESELESKGILYHSSSLSSLFSLERLAKESIDSDSSLDNPKLRKSNKSDSIVKIGLVRYSNIIRIKQSKVLCFLIKSGFLPFIY